MDRSRRRNVMVLWGLVLLAIAFGALLHHRRTLTGLPLLDGALGVILGLYVCSHPAAHAIDLLFQARGAPDERASGWAGLGWLALNLLALLAGWLLIFLGTTRLVG
ncbi:MAG: hypothetical protein H0V51_09170 [Chloroflexi bacterium]|nr:hypothetical protein [Chloroflexota bacterium]